MIIKPTELCAQALDGLDVHILRDLFHHCDAASSDLLKEIHSMDPYGKDSETCETHGYNWCAFDTLKKPLDFYCRIHPH